MADTSRLIIEFYERGAKVAECPASEVFGLKNGEYKNFWYVQDLRERSIALRLEGESNE